MRRTEFFELLNLVAEMSARLRIDHGDGGRDRKPGGVADGARRARRDLHDPGAEADAPVGQHLSRREPAADEFDHSRILGVFAVIENIGVEARFWSARRGRNPSACRRSRDCRDGDRSEAGEPLIYVHRRSLPPTPPSAGS